MAHLRSYVKGANRARLGGAAWPPVPGRRAAGSPRHCRLAPVWGAGAAAVGYAGGWGI